MAPIDTFSRRSFQAASLTLLAGCRLNKLPKYHSRLHKAFLVVDVPRDATVETGNAASREPSGVHALVDAAVNIAQEVISVRLQRRLRELVPAGRVREMVATIMVERMPDIGLEHVAIKDGPDTRMQLAVPSYGITSSSDLDPAKYHFDFRSLLVYEPEGKKIWRFNRRLAAPIADVHVAVGHSSVVGNISNAAALNDLTDMELERMLVQMVTDATHLFMDQLAYDFNRARMGHG